MKYISGKIIRLVAGLSLVAYMVGSCSKPSREARDLECILQSAKRHFMQRNIDSAIYYADSLRWRSDTVRSPHAYIASLVYLGEGHMIKGNDDSMVAYFNRASELAVRYRDDWALGVMNNILGIQSLYNRLDSKRCINCLLDGLRFAERSGDETLISMLKCNLALAYYVRRDPSGLEYARDVYDTGVGKKDMYMIYCGSLTSAYMYYCVGEYETAGEYIVTALPLAHTYKDEHGVYTLYGDILLKLGREAEAKACYDKALATNNPEDRFSGIDIYLSYGNYLKDGRRYRQALTMLESGIEIADRNANTMNRYLLYEAAAQICSLMSDRGGYERYMMLYKGIGTVSSTSTASASSPNSKSPTSGTNTRGWSVRRWLTNGKPGPDCVRSSSRPSSFSSFRRLCCSSGSAERNKICSLCSPCSATAFHRITAGCGIPTRRNGRFPGRRPGRTAKWRKYTAVWKPSCGKSTSTATRESHGRKSLRCSRRTGPI